MNRYLRAISFWVLAVLLCTGHLSALAQADTDSVVTNVIFDGVNYENRTEFAWEWHKPIPEGGIKWDGDPEYLFMDDYTIDEIVDVASEDHIGTQYVNNQIAFMSEKDVDFYSVELIAAKYGCRIVGYLAPTGDYVIESIIPKDYYELLKIVDELKKEEALLSDTVNLRYVYTFDTCAYPSDPWGNASWDQSNPEGYNWSVEAIKAPTAWDYINHMQPLNIGIIDSTFFSDHPDINYIARYNRNQFSNGSQNAFEIMNQWGAAANKYHLFGEKYINAINQLLHGTHVAGTFCAIYDNGIGISGVFPRGNIIAIGTEYQNNTFDMSQDEIRTVLESQTQLHINVSDPYLEKYYFLVMRRHDVKVINMSLGNNDKVVEGFDLSDPEQNRQYSLIMTERYTNTFGFGEFFNRIEALGYDFVFVNAAGNMERNAQANYWPEFISQDYFRKRLIVVGSYGIGLFGNYHFSSFSNYGEVIDILAPGENIYSTLFTPILGQPTYDNVTSWDSIFAGLKHWDGTSMAAPHVAGTAAMIWSINPELSGADVKKKVLESVNYEKVLYSNHSDDVLPDGRKRPYYLLDAGSAVILTMNGVNNPTPKPTVTPMPPVEPTATSTLIPTPTPALIEKELQCALKIKFDSLYDGMRFTLKLENAQEGIAQFDVILKHNGVIYIDTKNNVYDTSYGFAHTEDTWQFYMDSVPFNGAELYVTAADGSGRVFNGSKIVTSLGEFEGYMPTDD